MGSITQPAVDALEPRLTFHADEGAGASVALSTGHPAVSLGWSDKHDLPTVRDEAAGAAVNNKLYVFGGFHDHIWKATRRVDRFDVAENAWRRMRDLPKALTHVATVIRGGDVWMVGGFLRDNRGPAVTNVYVYHAATDTYDDAPSLPEPRGAGAAAITGDTLAYFGGNDRKDQQPGDDKRTMWTLDLNDADAGWTRRRSMPTARNHIAAATLGGNVYAIGGQLHTNAAAEDVTDVARYNPKKNRWARVAGLPAVTSHVLPSTFVYGGAIYTVGGESSYNVSRDEVYRYDPSRNRWTLYARLPKARRTPIVGLFGDELILTAGSYTGGIQTGDTLRTRLPG